MFHAYNIMSVFPALEHLFDILDYMQLFVCIFIIAADV